LHRTVTGPTPGGGVPLEKQNDMTPRSAPAPHPPRGSLSIGYARRFNWPGAHVLVMRPGAHVCDAGQVRIASAKGPML